MVVVVRPAGHLKQAVRSGTRDTHNYYCNLHANQ